MLTVDTGILLMRMKIGTRKTQFIAGIIILPALIWFMRPTVVMHTYEDVMMFIAPSAERAYQYGTGYFDATHPELYDIDRAEMFFNESRELDPLHTLTYHQLARIEFLRGDFYHALVLIDKSITLQGESVNLSSVYVRGLILGFMGRYDEAARSFEIFLAEYPGNWAAVNDYAWVLLKAGRAKDAAAATMEGLEYFPDNPWLLNSHATALYELGEDAGAYISVQKASMAVEKLMGAEWLRAYPGNDPKIAEEGIAAFKKAIAENMHTIELAFASSTVQPR